MSEYKLVTIQFDETAALVVRASSDDEARAHVMKTFTQIPGLEIISIEDASDDIVAEAKKNSQFAERSIH